MRCSRRPERTKNFTTTPETEDVVRFSAVWRVGLVSAGAAAGERPLLSGGFQVSSFLLSRAKNLSVEKTSGLPLSLFLSVERFSCDGSFHDVC